MGFEYLQHWKLHNLSGKTVLLLGHSHSKEVFPYVHMELPVFQFAFVALGSVSGDHWKEPVSILYAFPSSILIC